MALVSGVLWGLANSFIPFFYLNLLLGAGVGYVIGEVVGRAVNRKRGRGLAAIAAGGVIISYLASIFIFFGLPAGVFHILFDLVSVALGVYFAVNRLR
jgi:hypothetical protein